MVWWEANMLEEKNMEVTNNYLNITCDLVARIPSYLAANYFRYNSSDYINTYGFNCYEAYIFNYKGYKIALTRGAIGMTYGKKILTRKDCKEIDLYADYNEAVGVILEKCSLYLDIKRHIKR